MAKRANAREDCKIKVKGLRLKRTPDGRWIDQYGRVLEEYTNRAGKQDLRPVGVGHASH